MHEGTREERVNLRTSAMDARGCVTPRDICCKESFLSALKIIRCVCLRSDDVSLVWKKNKENGNLKGVGEWRGSKLNGRYEDYYENGQLRKKTTMIDNKMNGIIETYYENGEIESSGNIKDDAYEGEVTVFPEDKKWEYAYTTAVYENGKANGLNISYKQDGTEHSRRCFLKDKEVQLDLCG